MAYKLIDYERLKAFSEGLKTKYATKKDIPKNLSDLKEDTTHRLVTDAEKEKWNNPPNPDLTDYAKKADLSNKLDKSDVVHEFMYQEREDKVLSEKGAYELSQWVNQLVKSNIGYVEEKIPNKLSQLANDKTFKTESEIQSMIEKASSLKKEVVTLLPATGKDDVIYLVKDPEGQDNNNYLEYLWLNGKYELIGSTQVDLSGYVTSSDLTEYATSKDLNDSINSAVMLFDSKLEPVQKATASMVDKYRDRAVISDDGKIDLTNGEKYTTPEYVSQMIAVNSQSQQEMYGSAIQDIDDKKLDKTDIQEFTQQELEEAFK